MQRNSVLGRGIGAGAIGALALIVGGLGVATAANGGPVVLGHSNSAKSVTTIKNTHGVPLSLVAKKGHAPLRVSNSTKVTGLNSDLLDGLSSGSLLSSGGQATSVSGDKHTFYVPLGPRDVDNSPGTLVAETLPLKAGTYLVSATAWIVNNDKTDGSICDVSVNGSTDSLGNGGGATEGYDDSSITLVVTVKSGDKIGEFCYENKDSAQPSQNAVLNASVVAIKFGVAPKQGTLGHTPAQ